MGLQAYIIQMRKYGPEMILETAQEDPEISPDDLKKLEQAILLRSREKTFKKGKWEDDPKKTIICLCGCERRIPVDRIHRDGRPAKYFNEACKKRHYRKLAAEERKREREARWERRRRQARGS